MSDLEALLVLRTEIENDLAALARITGRLQVTPERLAALPPSDPTLAATAFELHNWYCVSENLMRRVATAFENALDPGEWHRQLLARMALDVPDVRPALIGPELRGQLDELRKFRHFFRNAYDRPLEPTRVADNLEVLLAAHGPWIQAVRGFLEWLEALAAGLRQGPAA